MKKFLKLLLKILKWLFIVLLACILLFFIVRFIGQRKNDKTPPKGINEEMYVDINGTQQWISIYGEDINNPVLLYLHGGPGSATSAYDYAFTRKWADVYTVVTWDQRNCGKSYSKDQDDNELTYNLMMSDGLEMTKFILEYLGTEKIVLLGHSWGSIFGANLALEYPQYYSCFIGTGQFINMHNNEVAFKEEAKKWVGDNSEGIELVNKLTIDNYTGDYYYARNALMEQYDYGLFADGQDYNMTAVQIFNPYYTLSDFVNWIQSGASPVYMNFLNSDEFTRFYLDDRSTYQIPYYNINGDKDYQCNYIIAQEYFDSVEALFKKMYIMKDTTHGLLESKSEQFSEVLHEIAEIEKSRGE
ncbi:MAG TPA: alpha/beta hydrolase [Lachnospiraceae bacterium]|nr:alpha/beta hydrolase [Lachnospiraceae bacterium]